MNTYRYIGTDPQLQGITALGQMMEGAFRVQVDDLAHPWSHYWHTTPREDWCSIVEIRAATRRDAHYLMDIDLKCFDCPWSPAGWRQAGHECVACVATVENTPVGMVIFHNDQAGSVEIVKIAVKEPWRNKGLATRLLQNCVTYAREIHAMRLVMAVPESRLRPNELGDISGWLKKLGFREEVPLLHDFYDFYGKLEDGVVFSLGTGSKCTTAHCS